MSFARVIPEFYLIHEWFFRVTPLLVSALATCKKNLHENYKLMICILDRT
jgi:hypothetical protein